MNQRVRLRIDGTVQGVGFRPYVYRLASALGLCGFVRNDGHGSVVEIEGPPPLVSHFIERLPVDAPPLALCERVRREDIPADGARGFVIAPSRGHAVTRSLIGPDTATCDECLTELRDPADRRFRYPFINCTNCGPRYSIVRGVPYDRGRTTMAAFVMCSRCQSEYENPADRRFHAQPNACPDCGPRARLLDAGGEALAGPAHDPIAAAADALRQGAIIAVKGIGGYHLACRAGDEGAVLRLRSRKHREDKPFALMATDVAAARGLVELDEAEERLLVSRARPIVLVRRRLGASIAAAVAPGHRDLGVMLPYSPLHHLLLADAGAPLVMTSGNRSDEPIAYRDDDALERLRGIADLFLVHDRPIETRTDDSIVRVVSVGGERRPLMLRRSRGYVPAALELPVATARPLLACGAQLKNTYCLVRGRRAWVGPHVGDLEEYETLRSFSDGIAHLERLCCTSPARLAHDLHPDYLSTSYAVDRAAGDSALESCAVQHHHAHLAACLAEHGHRGPAIGIIFDGTGYGLDATVWGGELLVGDLRSVERAGHLREVAMPGGAAAIREPWRMACAWLTELCDGTPGIPHTLAARVAPATWNAVARLARTDRLSPRTSSMGRLLDALSALCGVRDRVTYEGQAAIELEMRADADELACYPLPIEERGGDVVLDPRELVRCVLREVQARVPVELISARVHNGIAHAASTACLALANQRDLTTVVLSGGVFQNTWLLEATANRLAGAGLRVLVPERLPVNDGGISYGQAAVAAATRARRRQATPSRHVRS